MTVAVYGASGWTGTLTARALERAGVPIILAGRDRTRLLALADSLVTRPPVRIAALDDRGGLARMLAGVGVVINCAGPYLDLGGALIEAALDVRCHYFDATGEHSFLRDVYARYGETALGRSVTLCPAFAAKGALGDWGASAMRERLAPSSILDEVAIAYAHGLREYFRPSAGSVLSAAGQGFFKQRDQYDPRRSVARSFAFPAPFGSGLALLVPGAEDVSLPRHLPVNVVRSYISLAPGSSVNEAWAESSLACLPWIPAVSTALRRSREALGVALREPREARSGESFMVAVEVAVGTQSYRMAIATRDAYAVTAEILVVGVRRLLAGAAPRGVIAPSELCEPAAALRALIAAGAIRVVRRQGWS